MEYGIHITCSRCFTCKSVDIPEEYLQHFSPLGWEHITLKGDYVWNLNEKTNFNNLRSLREKNYIKRSNVIS